MVGARFSEGVLKGLKSVPSEQNPSGVAENHPEDGRKLNREVLPTTTAYTGDLQ